MSTRSFIVILLALAFGGSAAVLVRQLVLSGTSSGPRGTTEILVAKGHIDRARTLTKEMFTVQPWPEDNVPAGAFVADQMEEIEGRQARVPIEAGEPIFASKLANRFSLSEEVSPGKLAYTIGTASVESANGGLLLPEDHVDVIFTPTGSKAGLGSEVVLHNLRIIAVNRDFMQPGEEESQDFDQVNSVTLDVTREQAKLLSWIQTRGTIVLALLGSSVDPDAALHDASLADLQRLTGLQSEPVEVPVEPAPEPEEVFDAPPQVEVLVSTRDIPQGAGVGQSSFAVVHRNPDEVPEGALASFDAAEILGSRALVSIVKGEILLASRFSLRGSFSDLLSPGMRAFRIESDAGRLVPEDRVDVVFTPLRYENRDVFGTVTLMEGTRIIATNDQPEGEGDAISGFARVQSVVLEVTPNQVEMLSWAKKNGTLDLALIAFTDEDVQQRSMSLEELHALLVPPEPEPEPDPEPAPVVEVAVAPPEPVTVTILELRNRALGQSVLQLFPLTSTARPTTTSK